MAQEKKKKPDGKIAKLASRDKGVATETVQKRFSTQPEDIVKILQDGRLLARTPEGGYYFTTTFYTQTPIADPNRYGRPSLAVSAEAAALLQ